MLETSSPAAAVVERTSAEQILRVRIGELFVVEPGPSFVFQGLGSCLALVIRDSRTGLAGGAHVLRPSGNSDSSVLPGKFVDSAVRTLVSRLALQGACVTCLTAKLAGGASMFSNGSDDRPSVGARNIEAAHAALERSGVPIEAEDVGGSRGRTVCYDTSSGMMRVETLAGNTKTI